MHLEEEGEGFNFLGLCHWLVRSRGLNGKEPVTLLARWPADKAMQHARDRIRELTGRSRLLLDPKQIVEDLSRFLGGWAAYFRFSNSAARFEKIRSYSRMRMALFTSKRKRRSWEFGWSVVAYQCPDQLRALLPQQAAIANRLTGPGGDTRYLCRVSQIRLIAIRDTPLSVDEVRNAIADPAAGGEVLFVGTVRDKDADKGVTALAYSAHPSAEAELRKVAESIAAKYPEAIAVAAVHRIGELAIGDLAVVVGVSCAHRAEAFHACHALIDELKVTVPVWKHQRFTDGTDEWVGSA